MKQLVTNSSDNTQVAGDYYDNSHTHFHSQQTSEVSPGTIVRVVRAIVEMDFPADDPQSSLINAFEVQEKIDHNKLIRSVPRIKDHFSKWSLIDQTINSINDEKRAGGKTRFLQRIKAIYRKVAAQIDRDTPNTADRGDRIFEYVAQEIQDLACRGNTPPDEAPFAAEAVTMYGFVECSILERPTTP